MIIRFRDAGHKEFYRAQADRCQEWDVYHKALMYVLGLSEDCRQHINEIYNYKDRLICPDCLQAAWQTSGSRRAVLMAYNLFNGYLEPTEPMESTPYMLYCDSNAPYFAEAIRLRYPEYTETTYYSIEDDQGHIVHEGITDKTLATAYCTAYAKRHGGTYTAMEQTPITATA